MIRPTAIILTAAALLGGAIAHATVSASASADHSPYSVPVHMVGAFNIDQPGDVPSASADGLQQAFHYDYHPPSSTISQAYQQYNMQDINGAISQYMWDYECHRVHSVVSPPPGAWDFCSSDLYPSMDYANLMVSVTNYLRVVQTDPVIKGYWVLDDWPWWDASAKNVLIEIHNLIQQYTPGRPAICGFGALIIPGGDEWNSALANNFSPQGCDEVGFYVYADSSSNPISADRYDWTMTALLSKMESDFRARGWDPAQTPLIGIPQAFGGQYRSGLYEVVPTGQSIVAQSKAFCQAGASSLVFYSWTLSDFSSPQTAENNSDMSSGSRQAIATCEQMWGSSPVANPMSTVTPTTLPAATRTPVTPAPTSTPFTPAPTSTPFTPALTSTPVTPAATGTPFMPAATRTPVTPAPTSTPFTPAATRTPVTPAPTSTPDAGLIPLPITPPGKTSASPVSFEAESSYISGPVEIDSYSSASNGKYIQFTSTVPSTASCPRASYGNGVATKLILVPTSGRYEVWSRITGKGATPNSYWLQVDATCPILVGGQLNVGADTWAWVNYQSGNPASTVWLDLRAGVHVIRLIGQKAGVDVDRVILTPDLTCQPSGTGNSCAGSNAAATQVAATLPTLGAASAPASTKRPGHNAAGAIMTGRLSHRRFGSS